MKRPLLKVSGLCATAATSAFLIFGDDDRDFIPDFDGFTQDDAEGNTLTEVVIAPSMRLPVTAEQANALIRADGDQREPVLNTQSQYNGVGLVNDRCTGVLIQNDVVLTAAHCFDNADNDIEFVAIHTELNGDRDVFRASATRDQLWMHPYYQPTPGSSVMPLNNIPFDVALVFLDRAAPDVFNTMDLTSVNMDVQVRHEVHVMGYSADLNGLHAHWNCDAFRLARHFLISDTCDGAQGISGGIVIDSATNNIIATNSALSQSFEETYHTPFFNGIFSDPELEGVMFEPHLEIRFVEVNSVLNVRSRPSTQSVISSQLIDGECVIVDGEVVNEGMLWLQVRFNTLSAPTVHQNVASAYLSGPVYMNAHEARRQCPNLP